MRIITYLGFTLLSILIQFTVMDFIQERLQHDENSIDLNISSQITNLKGRKDILKAQALYSSIGKKLALSTKIYSNLSIPETSFLTTTEYSNTVFEILYEDNISTTDSTLTTEAMITSTEFENVTEITLFNKSNNTKNITTPKISHNNAKCDCDLLVSVCDIECCCDGDCSDKERRLFSTCINGTSKKTHEDPICLFQTSTDKTKYTVNTVEDLFCVAKMNIPPKRIDNKKYDFKIVQDISKKAFKWQNNVRSQHSYEFSMNQYAYNDLIWLLKNGSLYYMDLPSATLNNYCSGRSEIKFLKKEKIICNVKLSDLEFIKIIEAMEETMIISPLELTANSSALNCTTFHCTAWNIIVCDKTHCVDYNKTLHEPSCTDNICKNFALRVDYELYYFDSKIINTTVKLYYQNVTTIVPFMKQEINVQFYLANVSQEKITKLSGNPGYLYNLPIIVSSVENNHSDNFFHSTDTRYNTLRYPQNINGVCAFTNIDDFVVFGINTRTKCRIIYNVDEKINSTDNCKRLQNYIYELSGITQNLFISPMGNPSNIKDSNWIALSTDKFSNQSVYGAYVKKNTELQCYNLLTKISFAFTFADMSDVENKQEFKILTADITGIHNNLTFNTEDVSTILTTDYIFIDVTNTPNYEFAHGPHLNVHLPVDFFFPFSSNYAYRITYSFFANLFRISVLLIINKITINNN